jgi:di/tricarboxylate transporter
VRPDVVAILVVLALNLTGVLTIQEALAGFGQPVVVLIAAVSIVGEGLIATGVAYRLGEAVMKAGGSNEARLVALVMVLAGTVGAFMSSSAIVAMFIPVVMAIANKTGLNRKRMLMPLSVAALISGMMTLIASSPNMIVEDTLRARGLAPFGFFSWTPFGAAVLATAIAFMVIVGRNMLSRQTAAEQTGARQRVPTTCSGLMALPINGAGYKLLAARPSSIDRWRRCNCSTALAPSSSASKKNISMAERNFCRRCLRPCSSPMTLFMWSAAKSKRSS